MNSLSSNAVIIGILGVFMDWQYSSYLVKGLPQAFLEEMQGIKDAATAMGNPDVATYLYRGVVRASA
jgi:hypothetical protein